MHSKHVHRGIPYLWKVVSSLRTWWNVAPRVPETIPAGAKQRRQLGQCAAMQCRNMDVDMAWEMEGKTSPFGRIAHSVFLAGGIVLLMSRLMHLCVGSQQAFVGLSFALSEVDC